MFEIPYQLSSQTDFPILGIGRYSIQATYLFDAIQKDNECEVHWTNFVDFLLKNLIPAPQSKLLLGNPEIFAVPHVKVNSKLLHCNSCKH